MNKYQEALDIIDMGGASYEQTQKARTLLMELIDKATPNKPMIESDGDWNGEPVYDTWVCPNCETKYELDYDHHDYCPNCGQHIDWREDE